MRAWKRKLSCVVALLAALWTSYARSEPPPIEDDLKYALPDASIAGSIRPAKLLAHPLVELLTTVGAGEEAREYFQGLRERLGLDIYATDRITAWLQFSTEAGSPAPLLAGGVLRFSEPFPTSVIAKTYVEVAAGGKKYWKPGPMARGTSCLHVADEKTLVVATSEEVLQKILASTGKKRLLAEQMASASLNHDFVAVALVAPARKYFEAMCQTYANDGAEDVAMQNVLLVLMKEAEAVRVFADLEGANLASISIDASSPEAATRLEGTAGTLARFGKALLASFLKAWSTQRGSDKELAEIAALSQELASGVTVRRDGQRVTITAATPKGFSERGKLLAEFVRRKVIETRYANNLHQLGIALHNYHDVFNQMPPSMVLDGNGKPLYSWRVAILPFLENNTLYENFRLDEPWDSEHNKQFIDKMPMVFVGAPGLPKGKTNLLALAGQSTPFQPSLPGDPRTPRSQITFGSIIDGLSNTAGIVQVPVEKAVPWTKPEDFPFDPEKTRGDSLGLKENDWFFASRLDGSIIKLKKSIDRETLKRFFIRNDGQQVNLEPWVK